MKVPASETAVIWSTEASGRTSATAAGAGCRPAPGGARRRRRRHPGGQRRGGIPTVREPDGTLAGVEAVINKTRRRAAGPRTVDVDLLVIATDVPQAILSAPLRPRASGGSASRRCARLQAASSPAGRWAKVEAVCRFVERAGRPAVITDLSSIGAAVQTATPERPSPPRDPDREEATHDRDSHPHPHPHPLSRRRPRSRCARCRIPAPRRRRLGADRPGQPAWRTG